MFQQDVLGSFDLGLLGPESGLTTDVSYIQNVEGDITSSDVTQQQTWAERMAGDKKNTLSSLASNAVTKYDDLPTFGHSQDEWLEASSDLHDMMELSELEEVKNEVVSMDDSSNDHQALIDEVELFLTRHETSTAMPSVDLPPEDIFEECPFSSTLLDEDDKRVAEQIIDQLFCDSINIDLNDLDFSAIDNNPQEIQTATSTAQEVDIKEESGYVSSLNMSELEMEDGTKVIFVIAPDSPEDDSASIIEVPSVQSEEESSIAYQELDSDESWSPAESACSPVGGKKRKPYERKSGVRRTRQPVIDKKERKKIQNVEAARRYRDKKKNEQQLLDEELDELVEKNISLKSQVNEKENELKTLKKLMVELGLIKIPAKK